MPFGRKPKLQGPLWTVVGTADLTAVQHRIVDTVLGMCCELYNALLESWRGQYRWHQSRHGFDGVKVADVYNKGRVCGDRGTLYSQFSEMRHSEQPLDGEDGLLWSDLSANVGRGVIDRFDKARAAFYDRCKQRKNGARAKVGYPRFKQRSRWRSIAIPDASESMVKPPDSGCGRWRLRVKGLGTIKFDPHNESRLVKELAAGGKVAEIRLVRKALRTEVQVVVRTSVPDPPAPAHPSHAIGIDLGIANRVACSNGDLHPGVAEDRSEVIARQKELSRHDNRCRGKPPAERFTPGRRRRVEALAKAHARLSERERHSVHRLVDHVISRCVAEGVDGIAAELLRIMNMVRNPKLADRISQQRWGMFLRLLEVKAARAGIAYAQVDPRNTSLDCSRCGHRKPKADLPLSVRVYVCERCGLRLDRDVNAAINVLVRAFGNEARKGGATPRCGQHAPATNGGPATPATVGAAGRKSTANPPPASTTGRQRRALARDRHATQYA